MGINYYFAPGTRENWKRAFAGGNVWGLPGNRRATWRKLKSGDIVFFYVERPISRLVGYGSISDSFCEKAPFFADDWGTATKWPLRFHFQVLWPPSGDPFNGPWVSVKGVVEGRTRKKFHELGSIKGEKLLADATSPRRESA